MFLDSWLGSVFGDPSTLALSGVTFLLVYYIYNYKDERYPDGPFQFPLVGNVPQIAVAGNMVSFLEKNRNIYGDVYTVRVGGLNRVVVCGYDNIHQLLIKNSDYTSTRKNASFSKAIQEATKNAPGIFWAPHPEWRTMRSFALSRLRDEGMGKSEMEVKILEEAKKFMDHFLEPSCGTPIEMSLMMTFLTSNIISQLVIGKRYDYTDPVLAEHNKNLVESIMVNIKASIISNLWFLRYLPGDISSMKRSDRNIRQVRSMRDAWILVGRENPDSSCYMSQVLKFADQQREEGQSEIVFNDQSVSYAAFQLYIAGTDTTSQLLRWALLCMMLHPDIQEKVRAEIKEQIGEREPTMADRLTMPYTDAVFHETLRIGNIGPTALPHTLTKELELGGKRIPANAELLINLTSVLHDEKRFPEPLTFKPERFMGEDGKALKAYNVAFGIDRAQLRIFEEKTYG